MERDTWSRSCEDRFLTSRIELRFPQNMDIKHVTFLMRPLPKLFCGFLSKIPGQSVGLKSGDRPDRRTSKEMENKADNGFWRLDSAQKVFVSE